MLLFRDVMDKQLVDCHDDKMGRVDDLLLDLEPGKPPAVRAIITGHGAGRAVMPHFLGRAVTWLEKRLLGLAGVEPVEIGWEHVTRIDVAVHLDVDRKQVGGTETEHALWERWIKPLPRSQR